MYWRVRGLLLTTCGLALLAGGCASHEVVKKDESIAPAAQTKAVTPAKKEATAKPVQQGTVVGTTLPTKSQQAVATEPASAEQIKAALDKVYFDFDSSDLSDQARNTLTKDADYMKKNATVKVRVEGNCDERGSDEYNLALGEKRAKAAAKYLVTMGVQSDRLSTISYGKEKPADPGHNEAAWAKNRRDDFVVVAK